MWLSRPRNDNQGPLSPRIAAVFAGLAVMGVVYMLFWYLPNRAELSHMLHQYRVQQIQPHSFTHLLQNSYHSILGDRRGLFPYLLRHTPILFTLVLILLAASICKRTHRPIDPSTEDKDDSPIPPLLQTSTQLFLTVWLLFGWLTLSVISYSPSRYYVSTYPAMAALAAIGLWRLADLLRAISGPDTAAVLARGGLAWLLSYHLIQSAVHREGVLDHGLTSLILYVAPTAIAIFVSVLKQISTRAGRPSQLAGAALVVWALVNAGWIAHWAFTMSYSQHSAARWLAGNLPAGSVIIGDPAPGLCMDNEFSAVPVIRGLCNDQRPLEQFVGAPRFAAVVSDSPLKAKFWNIRYPGLLGEGNLARSIHVLTWDVELYKVPADQWIR